MSGIEKRASKRVPVALRIKLRYRKVDTFVSKFATNISATGIFISSRKPKPSGTQLRFELRLADDSVVIAGRGRVSWILEYDKSRPKSPHGMGIEFTSLAKGSRALVEKIVERRIEQGLGEAEGIPHALQEKDLAQVVKGMKTVPETETEISPPSHDTPKTLPSAPTATESGVVELSLDDIDSSSIDLQSVLDRAKSLVGRSEIDKELSELFRVSAAPVAETVDDASHRLAQLLGGKAVQSQRMVVSAPLDSPPLATQRAEVPKVKADPPAAIPEAPEVKADPAAIPEVPEVKADPAAIPEVPEVKADPAAIPEVPEVKADPAAIPEVPAANAEPTFIPETNAEATSIPEAEVAKTPAPFALLEDSDEESAPLSAEQGLPENYSDLDEETKPESTILSDADSKAKQDALQDLLEGIEDFEDEAVPEPVVAQPAIRLVDTQNNSQDMGVAENHHSSGDGALLVLPSDQPEVDHARVQAQSGPPPVPKSTDVLASAIELLGEDEHTTVAPLNFILAGIENDRENTPATILASQSKARDEVTQEGSVDFILDDDALNELEVIEENEDELDLPDVPKLPV